MKLSTRGRYGTRLLLDIATQGNKPVFLKDIARRQNIPLPYLKRLVSPLVAGGLLRSSRGIRGGVGLAKPPDQIKLSDVIRLLEGPINFVECVENTGICDRSGLCITRDVWGEMSMIVNDFLESITLRDLVERQKTKEQSCSAMYNI